MPDVGSRHRFTADRGLAAQARIADPDVSDELPSEHADLDLTEGTTVVVSGFDEDRGLLLVEWTDRSGNPRITSVEPATFDANFTPED